MTKPKAKPTPAVPVSQLSKRRATSVAGVSLTDKVTTKGKASGQTETGYLNSSPTNAARLQKSKSKVGLGQRTDTQSLPAFDMQALATEVARQLGANVLGSGSLSNCDSTNVSYGGIKSSPSVGTSLKCALPIDHEISIMTTNLETVHVLISELNAELEPFLAHEEVSDKESECGPGRSSDSPLHRRLMDRNESLENVIARLRYMKSRVRN